MVSNIEQKTFAAKTYIGYKKTVSFSEISSKEMYAEAFGKVMEYMGQKQLRPAGPAAVVYFTWDDATQTTELAACMQVEGVESVEGDVVELVKIPETEAVVAHHEGDYATLKDAYDEVMKYLKENPIETGWAVEEYIVDPMQNPDPAQWRTDIWFLKK